MQNVLLALSATVIALHKGEGDLEMSYLIKTLIANTLSLVIRVRESENKNILLEKLCCRQGYMSGGSVVLRETIFKKSSSEKITQYTVTYTIHLHLNVQYYPGIVLSTYSCT